MTCKSCGGNYRARELLCPFCGRENALGRVWKARRDEAEQAYEAARKEAGRRYSPYVADRILSRVLALEILAGIVFFLLVGGFSLAEGLCREAYVSLRGESIARELEALAQEREFVQMETLLDRWGLYGREEFYPWCQASLMARDYESFTEHRIAFLAMDEEEKREDDYHLEYSIRDAQDILTLDCGLYSELAPENRALYEEYCREASAYLTWTLGCTGEELAALSEQEEPPYGEYERMAERARERGSWR